MKDKELLPRMSINMVYGQYAHSHDKGFNNTIEDEFIDWKEEDNSYITLKTTHPFFNTIVATGPLTLKVDYPFSKTIEYNINHPMNIGGLVVDPDWDTSVTTNDLLEWLRIMFMEYQFTAMHGVRDFIVEGITLNEEEETVYFNIGS